MRNRARTAFKAAIILLGVLAALQLPAQRVKEANTSLDHVAFARPEMRVPETNTDAELIREKLSIIREVDQFRAENGPAWRFTIDERRDRIALLDGGAIPFIPGSANDLKWEGGGPDFRGDATLSQAKVEALARQFLANYRSLFRIDPSDLVLDPDGTLPIGDSIYLLRFQWTYAGIPVDRGSVYFRINGGNLIQVGTEYVGPISLDPRPYIEVGSAWQSLKGYLGSIWSGRETILDRGSLIILPMTPAGRDPNLFSGPLGSQVDYRLAYRLVFKRPGTRGMWEALVDAHDGEIIAFRDVMKYGHVHGGVYPSDGRPPEGDRPFPFADLGGGLYSSEGGSFAGNDAVVTLTGKYTHLIDDCGDISNTTTTGDANFGLSGGTDCTVPTPNGGGAGNTHAARTLFYHATQINMKARTYLPTNTWLNTDFITCHVNQPAYCNASSGGGVINFYKASSPCTNLGEIPGVALHEWGHSLDDFDGSGGGSPPVETRADWTAQLQTHDSCEGRGAFTSGNCDGYGNGCTDCTGIREADRMKHTNTTPWTIANYNSVWGAGNQCDAGYYYGPCGKEDHCESGISTQALWEFVNTDLPALNGVDVTTAWQIADRLFYSSMPTMGNMYSCTPPNSNGCGAGSLYTTFRAIDDTGDGTSNGTPHAAAIFAALSRHNIACGTAADDSNKNQSSCPSLAKPVVTGTAGSNSVSLSWGTVANATRYFIFRNDTGCTAGYTRIGTVASPATGFTDPYATNGLMSYYRVSALAASDSCEGPISDCVSLTPQPCAGSVLLDKAVYNCSDTVHVTMVDSNVPGDPATVTVSAWSNADPTLKAITLTKSAASTYTGSFTTTAGAAGASQVKVADGATITVRYVDADYCGTPGVNVDVTALADCAVPIISGVHAVVAGTNVDISWTTNEAANGFAAYDTVTPPSAGTKADGALVTSHTLHLAGLTPCANYFYLVRSTDVAGNQAVADNGGAYFTFATGQNVQPTYSYSGPPVAIPDEDPAGASATIAVAEDRDVQKVTVTITSLTHTWDGDLTISLVGPDGTAVLLSVMNGGSGQNYIDTVFDDGATTPIGEGEAPFTGTFKPDAPLGGFVGKSSKGDWKLHAVDSGPNDVGTINGWSIALTYPPLGCGPSLDYVSNTWTSACTVGGPGNGDAYIDPGEDVSIIPTLENNGTASTTGVRATLSCNVPGVTVTAAESTFPDLTPGNRAPSLAPFLVHLIPTVPCGTQLDFTIHMWCSEKPAGWDENFSLVVGHVIPGGPQTVFHETFDGVIPPALPAGWTTEVISGNAWETYSGYACSDPNQLNYSYNSTEAADSWAFTPGMNLQAGTTYTLRFDDRVASSSYPENLSIFAGNAAGSAGMSIPVWSEMTILSETCTAQTPTFTVPASGTYFIGFHCTSDADMWRMIIDDLRLTYEQQGACNVTVCPSPTCEITCAATVPASGTAGNDVPFQASSTTTHCTGTVAYAWNFGDGGTSALQNPTHAYASAGTYTWTVTASVQGVTCTKTGSITIAACSLSCTATVPGGGFAGVPVSFQATATPTHCTGSPTFSWSFGDGKNSTAQDPSHTYTSTGTFNWSMTALVEGVTCTRTGTITVTAPPTCVLTCTATVPSYGVQGAAMAFSSSASPYGPCDLPVTYAWAFGDGATSAEQSPSHPYGAAGTYSWSFTATAGTVTCVQSGTLVVSPGCCDVDVNCDGAVNILDMIKVQRCILGLETGAACLRSDVNHDATVNILDMIKVQRSILGLDICG